MAGIQGAYQGPRPLAEQPDWTWQNDAACRQRGPGLFFAPDGEREPQRNVRERKAKAVCARCPVRAECLSYAMERPERYGTWGGMGEDERASTRRRLLRKTAHDANVRSVQQRLAQTFAERAS